ncbi:MAG: hypothetical protein J7L95_07920 [Prolixibacteraceae bacterium]|nr:hypothetical protein [Prolixibacteraceae bacterium]
MEQPSDAVFQGKVIYKNSYRQRATGLKKFSIEDIKIDYFDSKNSVIHKITSSFFPLLQEDRRGHSKISVSTTPSL